MYTTVHVHVPALCSIVSYSAFKHTVIIIFYFIIIIYYYYYNKHYKVDDLSISYKLLILKFILQTFTL